MTDLRTVAQQALEALENSYPMETTTPREHEDAITALRAALAQQEPRNQCGETCERAKLCAVCAKELAQQEQEPVAWIQSNHLQQAQREPFLCRVEPTQRLTDFVPLYTQPPRALRAALSQQEQEPLSAEVERLRYLILEIAGAMRTKAANNPYIKATTLDALADELLAGISAALAQQEQATGKESLQVEFRGGGQIATPLQLTTDDLAWLETRRLVRVWTELGQIRWTGADQGWDRAIEAVRARLDKECQDVLAWKEKVEASGQTAAQLLQKLRGMKDD